MAATKPSTNRTSPEPNEFASYERHLGLDHVVDPKLASNRERFEALSRTLRDLLTPRWLKTQQTYDRENPKFAYCLSMEFLLGRSLINNISNLRAERFVSDLMNRHSLELSTLADTEPDASLGNGGLGRLAACFIDSLATMQIPAIGYGLRYEYGIFRQEIKNGFQAERPDNWLSRADPSEVRRSQEPRHRLYRTLQKPNLRTIDLCQRSVRKILRNNGKSARECEPCEAQGFPVRRRKN